MCNVKNNTVLGCVTSSHSPCVNNIYVMGSEGSIPSLDTMIVDIELPEINLGSETSDTYFPPESFINIFFTYKSCVFFF